FALISTRFSIDKVLIFAYLFVSFLLLVKNPIGIVAVFFGIQAAWGGLAPASPEPTAPIVAFPSDATATPIVIVIATPEPTATSPTATFTATPTETPTGTLTPTPTMTPTPTFDYGVLGHQVIPLGMSVEGRPIEAIRFGNGLKNIVLVGGLHSGFSPNTVDIALATIDYFKTNPELIPNDISLFIIPNGNPDSANAVGELAGRLNARGVDLNRNWECDWATDPNILSEVVAGGGGTEPFSEPEVAAIDKFIRDANPEVVAFWFGGRREQGYVSPGACDEPSDLSVEVSKIFASAANYSSIENDIVPPNEFLTGDVVTSLNQRNIRAIAIFLSSFFDVEWDNNLAGLLALLDHVSDFEPVATRTPLAAATKDEIVLCLPDPGLRWGPTLHNEHRERLGCAITQEMRPRGFYQLYEDGLMVLRADEDGNELIYALYYEENRYSVHDALGQLSQSEGDALHKGAFGYLWVNNVLVRDKLGDPIEHEAEATEFAIQDFETGTIFYFFENQARNYVLFEELGQWTAAGG
ncbi:MAG: M14 family metallopeptidase, partial [Chloroflexota bacterium]